MLIVTGDVGWAQMIGDLFAEEGFAVVHCRQGAAACEQLAATAPDLVLLDLSLPDRYGPTICSLMRAQSPVPIVAVDTDMDESRVISALAAGADAIATKRRRSRELLARARVLLRRVPPAIAQLNVLIVGPVRLDRAARKVDVNGRRVLTTRREFEILELLMGRAGAVVSRDEVMRSVWDAGRDAAILDVHVRRLRLKLETHEPWRRIETVRGRGFRFAVDPKEPAVRSAWVESLVDANELPDVDLTDPPVVAGR